MGRPVSAAALAGTAAWGCTLLASTAPWLGLGEGWAGTVLAEMGVKVRLTAVGAVQPSGMMGVGQPSMWYVPHIWRQSARTPASPVHTRHMRCCAPAKPEVCLFAASLRQT